MIVELRKGQKVTWYDENGISHVGTINGIVVNGGLNYANFDIYLTPDRKIEKLPGENQDPEYQLRIRVE